MLSLAGGGTGSGTGDAGRSSSWFKAAEVDVSSVMGAGLVGEVTTSLSSALCSDSLRSVWGASLVVIDVGDVVSAKVAFVGVAASALSVIASGVVESVVVVVVGASSNCTRGQQWSLSPALCTALLNEN
jgi:hypothetical protein